MVKENWQDFKAGKWQERIDVRDFIQKNYTPYEGDASFLEDADADTEAVWQRCLALMAEERKKGGVLAVDADRVATVTSHAPGYIDKEHETIVGLQLDEPLKRGLIVNGGLRTAKQAAEAYGYKVNPAIEETFSKYTRTHNEAVFDLYTPEMRKARHLGLLTGLPDAYGRGRIIGDYRRVALYGVDRLVAEKKKDKEEMFGRPMDFETLPVAHYQPAPTVNYPCNYDFTRITEFRQIHPVPETVQATTILREYPQAYVRGENTAYYPIFTDEAKAAYAQYAEAAKAYPHLHLIGRLAEYRYYDMDDAARRALDLAQELKREVYTS